MPKSSARKQSRHLCKNTVILAGSKYVSREWHLPGNLPRLVHTGYGLSSISHVAETSRIQGLDLYTGDVGARLRFGLDFHMRYETGVEMRPDWLCPVQKKLVLGFGPGKLTAQRVHCQTSL
jgi:hypothetical protein